MNSTRERDPYWWVSPVFRDKIVSLDGILDFKPGSVKLIDREVPEDLEPVLIEHGEFSALGGLLFMINGHRPGPVKGFYVVVEAKRGEAWCVGQLHANSVTPLRVFANKFYPSEDAARQAAEKMRVEECGNAPPRMN